MQIVKWFFLKSEVLSLVIVSIEVAKSETRTIWNTDTN